MKKLIVFAILVLLFSGIKINAQTDSQKATKIDSLLQVYTQKNMFCGSVLVAKNGKILLSKGYGMANYNYNIPNTNLTKFKLASVSKQFTAMLIMILEERGKLSTDDKL